MLLPAQYTFDADIGGAKVLQLRKPPSRLAGSLREEGEGRRTVLIGRDDGQNIVFTRRTSEGVGASTPILKVGDPKDVATFSKGKWLNPTPSDQPVGRPDERATAWHRSFRIRAEHENTKFGREAADGSAGVGGLRPPQIGAYHALKAHWTVSEDAATVVMPTGTGKTETMLALFASEMCERLTVIVPSDALRTQVGNAFLGLGLLRRFGIIAGDAPHPVVAFLTSKPRTEAEVDAIYETADVVITTMALALKCEAGVQRRMAERSSHLFIDEAHHVPAAGWMAVKRVFTDTRIVQFTATPFRSDGKSIEGRVVYAFPIRTAQEQGYFAPIAFEAVDEVDLVDADIAIAEKAIEVLEERDRAGFAQVAMARCGSIARANRMHELYLQMAPEKAPILLHSSMKARDRREGLRRLREGEARIVVCVDMLGEGFDLPSLKIAAIHDQRRGLAITLQFVGRFTRTAFGEDLGPATAIANIGDLGIGQAIRELYAEDADWNALLPTMGELATRREVRKAEVFEGFSALPDTVALQNIKPKMSMSVFRAPALTWDPLRLGDILVRRPNVDLHDGPHVNHKEHLVYAITREGEELDWVDAKGVANLAWHLYLVHFDSETELLYINSSNKASMHGDIARAVIGRDVDIVKGEDVYRALDGIGRVTLRALGLNEKIRKHIRHIQSVGENIAEDLPDADRLGKTKTNLVATGYADGERVAIGASHKGRVWELREARDIPDWMEWCRGVGPKLVDDTISTEEVLRKVILPTRATERPPYVPIAVEWPLAVSVETEARLRVRFSGEPVPLEETELQVVDHSEVSPLRIRVRAGDDEAIYRLQFSENGVSCVSEGVHSASLVRQRTETPFGEWFGKHPPVVRFANGGHLEGDQLCLLPAGTELPLFDADRIDAWDWADVNIRRESQTVAKLPDTVQRKTIETALASTEPHFDIVMDDDGSGEAADIVCIGMRGDRILVRLYHCKFAGGDKPGARIGDLYEVCGQAQRSVRWGRRLPALITNLRRRNSRRHKKTGTSRFERGDEQTLKQFGRIAARRDVEFEAVIVQPGLSKAAITNEQRALLSSTEAFLSDVGNQRLTVVGSW